MIDIDSLQHQCEEIDKLIQDLKTEVITYNSKTLFILVEAMEQSIISLEMEIDEGKENLDNLK